MNTDPRGIQALVERIRAAFPTQPIPPYPEGMGCDPLGVDEYAEFANCAWSDIDPRLLQWTTYDISPGIGFSLYEPPHMWNYFVPAFLCASLLGAKSYDIMIMDGFLWRLREVLPGPRRLEGKGPWWEGTAHFERYSREQDQCVLLFLEWAKLYGSESPWVIDWEEKDQASLECWQKRVNSEA